MRVLEAIGEFFAAIGRGILYLLGLLVRYFYVYFPALILFGFVMLWFSGAMQNMDFTIYGVWDLVEYEFNITVAAANWLVTFEHNFFTAITLGVIQVALVVLAAIFDFIFIYVIFFGVGSLIMIVIQLVLWLTFLFVVPVGAAVYSVIITLKTSERHNCWFYILIGITSIVFAIIHYCYLIPFTGWFG